MKILCTHGFQNVWHQNKLTFHFHISSLGGRYYALPQLIIGKMVTHF